MKLQKYLINFIKLQYLFYSNVFILHSHSFYMKRFFSPQFIGIIFLTLVPFSCSSDLDINQAKNLRLAPTYIANLLYFDIPVNEFIVNGSEIPQFKDQSTVTIFNSSFFVDDLVKVDLDFEIENTISKSFTMDVKFYNTTGNQVDFISISVPAYMGVSNKITHRELFQGSRLSSLKNTSKIIISLQPNSGPSLTTSSSGRIKLRSGLTAYFII